MCRKLYLNALKWTKSHSFIRVLSKNYCIWVRVRIVLGNFKTSPTLISKLHRWFSPLVSCLFLVFWSNKIKRTNPYKNYIRSLHILKKVAKLPTNQTVMTFLHRSFVIESFIIGTKTKGSDIQKISLRMSLPYVFRLIRVNDTFTSRNISPSFGTFLAWNNLARIENLGKPFYWPKYPRL